MWPRVWQMKIWLENYDQSAIFEWPNTVPKENWQQNDYQPEKKKIKVEVMDSDSEEIQKLKVEEIDLQQGQFDENLEENDYQPEKKKIKLEGSDSDSEEIKKLKDTIEKLKQKKMYFIQLAKKFSDEKQKLEKSNKKLREENLRLRERNLETGKTEK